MAGDIEARKGKGLKVLDGVALVAVGVVAVVVGFAIFHFVVHLLWDAVKVGVVVAVVFGLLWFVFRRLGRD